MNYADDSLTSGDTARHQQDYTQSALSGRMLYVIHYVKSHLSCMPLIDAKPLKIILFSTVSPFDEEQKL